MLIVATLVSPKTDYGSSVVDKQKELASIAAHKGTYVTGGVLFLVATTFLLFAGVGLIKYFRGPRGVTLGQVGGFLLTLGSMVGAGWYGFGAVEDEMGVHRSDALLNTFAARHLYGRLLPSA